jgi:thioester reductase-like protein
LIHDIKTLLKNKGANALAKQIDLRLLQEISVSELFELAEQFENASALAVNSLRNKLAQLQKEYQKMEQERMMGDIHLNFEPELPIHYNGQTKTNILLTGGTGFFGPFILKSLLEYTTENIYILVRAKNTEHGKERLKKAFAEMGKVSAAITDAFEARVIPVCGDLGKPQLGLDDKTWDFLTQHITTIYNNGAIVNYLYNYDKMRDVNVEGTNEIVKFALAGKPKIFNHISTTFIFGWAVKDVLLESDINNDLDLLDFGYSQTKWVSEQIIRDAMKKGLKGRIFRPALITPSVDGGGNNFDISIRLVAFMVNHRIGVGAQNQVSFTPADVAANNIVAISQSPDSMDKTFHVTRDHYANMGDITDLISELTGIEFKIFPLKQFVPEIIDRCTTEDLLFPLLDFFTRSVDKISVMEFKRYDSSNFQTNRDASPVGQPDPSLKDTVRGMLRFMKKNELINVPLLEEEVLVNQ